MKYQDKFPKLNDVLLPELIIADFASFDTWGGFEGGFQA